MTSYTISVRFLSSSRQLFIRLHYCQAKCSIHCLTLNRAHGIILIKNAAIKEIKESIAWRQIIRRHCISAAYTAVCSTFQEGTNAVHAIIPGGYNLKV